MKENLVLLVCLTILSYPFCSALADVKYYPNGKKEYEVPMVDGKKHGVQISFSYEGYKQSELTFASGVENGSFTEWHSDGKPMTKGIYRDGKQDGLWERFNFDGTKEESIQYSAGATNFVKRFHPNGRLGTEVTFGKGGVTSEKVFDSEQRLLYDAKCDQGQVSSLVVWNYKDGNKKRDRNQEEIERNSGRVCTGNL